MGVGKAGIKQSGNPDVLLISLEEDAPAGFIFTRSSIRSGSVSYSEKALNRTGGYVRALFINSGNANCSAGDTERVAENIASYISHKIGTEKEKVLVFSTGVIGEPLPMDKIVSAIDQAINNTGYLDLKKASEVISTTDRFPKYASYKERDVEVIGFAKGAGMIHPNMATMLAFLFVNSWMDPKVIKNMVKFVGDRTFNSISVDGCTSTNDSFGVICIGKDRRDVSKIKRGIYKVAEDLAKRMVEDGEGATKIIKIIIEGAKTERMARDIARSVATSQLVKTAVHGNDPNWGRIIASVGSAGYDIKEEDLEIRIGGEVLFRGVPVGSKDKARKYMLSTKEVEIRVRVGSGRYEWVYYSSDLTCDYVKFNAEYTT